MVEFDPEHGKKSHKDSISGRVSNAVTSAVGGVKESETFDYMSTSLYSMGESVNDWGKQAFKTVSSPFMGAKTHEKKSIEESPVVTDKEEEMWVMSID